MLTPDQLAALRAAAEAATPGPWWIDSHGKCMVNANTRDVIFTTSDDMGPLTRHDSGFLSRWRNDNDASYIAAANPAAIQELLAEIDAKTARIDELERDAALHGNRRMTGQEAIELAGQITQTCYLWGRPNATARWAMIQLQPWNARGIEYGMRAWEFVGPIYPPEAT